MILKMCSRCGEVYIKKCGCEFGAYYDPFWVYEIREWWKIARDFFKRGKPYND
jgi:hypothetical protein